MKIKLLTITLLVILIVAIIEGFIIKSNSDKLSESDAWVRSATYLASNDLEHAVDIVDYFYEKEKKIPKKYSDLEKYICSLYANSMYEKAKKAYDSNLFPESSNSFRIGDYYSKLAGVKPPDWAVKLHKKVGDF